MDDRIEPKTSADSPRSAPGNAAGWRGDIRDRPPVWPRRPRPERELIPLRIKKKPLPERVEEERRD
jgi:hypothetical protein